MIHFFINLICKSIYLVYHLILIKLSFMCIVGYVNQGRLVLYYETKVLINQYLSKLNFL